MGWCCVGVTPPGSFFSNYWFTLPFAHAYHYHLDIWTGTAKPLDKDVYISPSRDWMLTVFIYGMWNWQIGRGNLLENNISTMDYLIAKLKRTQYCIVITAQTNLGTDIPSKTYRRAASPINMINAIYATGSYPLHKKPIFMVWWSTSIHIRVSL